MRPKAQKEIIYPANNFSIAWPGQHAICISAPPSTHYLISISLSSTNRVSALREMESLFSVALISPLLSPLFQSISNSIPLAITSVERQTFSPRARVILICPPVPYEHPFFFLSLPFCLYIPITTKQKNIICRPLPVVVIIGLRTKHGDTHKIEGTRSERTVSPIP